MQRPKTANADQRETLLRNALHLLKETGSRRLLVFLNTEKALKWFLRFEGIDHKRLVLVIPKDLRFPASGSRKTGLAVIRSWAGNQSRFSHIKYAFLQAVVKGIIKPGDTVVCLLGPWGKGHLDTITVHDLSRSWSEEFPFDPSAIMKKRSFNSVMAVVDIALDIGAMGREGKSVGTTFVIGDISRVMKSSHQAVFNPFKGYSKKEKIITLPEVVESIKELAQLDGAFVISSSGIVEAAGRHLDTQSVMTRQLRGLGSRHRAAAGITRKTNAVSVVVSESTGKITIFNEGRIVSALEPVISRRLV